MLSKKLPSYASMSVLSKMTVPTALGTAIMLLVKIPKIIETANSIKKEIAKIKQLLDNNKAENYPPNEEVEATMG